MREFDIIERLRRIATAPEALGLLDDVAVLGSLVVTHDTIAESVHFLPEDPPASVGWKLVAVNLSDIAAKGASPVGALLSLTITGPGEWELDFLAGIEAACESYGLPLIGGDTIGLPIGAPRVLGLTAIGRAGEKVPRRSGALAGDALWLIGTVGDAAGGIALLREDPHAEGPLVDIYRRPVPQLEAGRILAPHAHAMMDVSDGLLLDTKRMAEASRCSIRICMDELPLSRAFIAERGHDLQSRLFAATGGDDYALLAAFPPTFEPATVSLPSGTRITRIGSIASAGPSLALTFNDETVELPERLGFEHEATNNRRLPTARLDDRP